MQNSENIRSVSIIGPGNVGWHLALALNEAGFEIRNIISRDPQRDSALGEIVDAQVVSDIRETSEEPDLYLICVPDSGIDSVAASLSGSKSIVVHTAGGTDMSVFSEKEDNYGVFYPLQTFTKGTDLLYSDIPFLLEADSEITLNKLEGVAEKISGNYRRVGARERIKLHVAAVFACNFSNHMLSIAHYLLNEEDLDLSLILPLLKQTMLKLDTVSPKEAQTGPAIRNDRKTMSRHLETLADEPELKDLYKALSQSIQNKKY